MLRLSGAVKDYAWGSPRAISDFTGIDFGGQRVAELWFGAHNGARTLAGGRPLSEIISADPAGILGADVAARFDGALPFLLKVIAPDQPLSLQVHPGKELAEAGFQAEEEAGIPLDSPRRNYRDRNHKPEMIFALTPFEAFAGFRAPRRAIEVLDNLNAPLAREMLEILRTHPGYRGLRAVARKLLAPLDEERRIQIEAVITACQDRLDRGTSPSLRVDRQAVALARTYPSDPGAVLSLLLNPVTLRAGEALFIPTGAVHAYVSGLGIEVMSSSDNVLRAGLTPKHIDAGEALRCMDFHGAPPVRIAPEMNGRGTGIYYAPVDDFELSVSEITGGEWIPIPGFGPRILLGVSGDLEIGVGGEVETISTGQAIFISAAEGTVRVRGNGKLVQAGVP
ncbi:mannose-6-phosphate isomerase, class I [Varibaculum cambriense]|uniref:mannose-6-phosphate isomerase, class I n=1 Tax=Varibaculum cambriense TaxID=184870 RepID=UPI0028FDCC82|nr:mannose-6-phosphate isomerase, class I [Varibaculum cambriense]MDU1224695.1 mannose-6-phosphate isomerase, class I [Varibaculum cambriense]